MQIYLTPDEARTRIFPEAVRFESQIHHVPSSYAQASADTLGSSLDLADSLVVSVARGKGGELLGYAAVTDEVGKFRPITFMVGIGADLRVRQVAVLVYRENRGSEVRRSRFLRQYRGKSSGDPIRINRDIVNVSGATMSVRAVNAGVRKVLSVIEALYGEQAVAGAARR